MWTTLPMSSAKGSRPAGAQAARSSGSVTQLGRVHSGSVSLPVVWLPVSLHTQSSMSSTGSEVLLPPSEDGGLSPLGGADSPDSSAATAGAKATASASSRAALGRMAIGDNQTVP